MKDNDSIQTKNTFSAIFPKDFTLIPKTGHSLTRLTMNKSTSLYLDFIRFSAALVVMLSHLGGSTWTGGLGWQFLPFGEPAVVIFFVLSGYVIAYAVSEKERSADVYLINRLARIYSVVIPALVLTAILGEVGYLVYPDHNWGYRSLLAYLQAATFTNQLWFSSIEPGNNGPYWSLGYEIWYYVLFGISFFVRGKLKIPLTLVGMVLVGPRILMMMPSWLMGMAAYHISKKARLGVKTSFIAWIATFIPLLLATGLTLYKYHMCHCTNWLETASVRPPSEWHAYIVDGLLGLVFSANFLFFSWSSSIWDKITKFIHKPISWLAGATFTLYLVHYPIARFLIVFSPWPVGSHKEQALVYIGTLASVFLLAQFTERKKGGWRRFFVRLIDWTKKKINKTPILSPMHESPLDLERDADQSA
jgi:peptidoglycan/LPS O-acetylase OafA/YrhL